MAHRRHLANLRGWDWRFDTGNMGTITEESGKIRLSPRLLSLSSSKWGWFAIRNDNLGGKIPRFLVAHTSKFLTFTGELFGAWATSLDTDNWNTFDNVDKGAADYEIYNNAPFPNGKIYICSHYAYPFSRTERLYQEWLKDARCSVLTIGQDTRRSSGDGWTIPALPYLGMKITSGGANTKNNCILAARNHPRETVGGFALEGAVNWLLAGSDMANFLLDWFDFYVYPCVNPTGVFSGYSSGNPENEAQHNDTTAGFDDLDAFTTAMNTNTGGDIEVGIDFHGYMGAVTSHGIWYDSTSAIAAAFQAAFLLRDATYTEETDTSAVVLTRWWTTDLSAALSMALENGMTSTRTIANCKTSGENTLKTVTDLHAQGRFTNNPGVGSRNLNGTTDRIDWANVFNTAGSALTISAWIYVDVFEASPNPSYLLCTHRSGDTSYGSVIAATYDGRLTFFRNGTTGLARYSAASALSTGAWTHVLITHSGSMTDYTTIHLFVNGTANDTADFNSNGASEYAATGSWSIGGRIYDDNRNLDGKIAQVAVWNAVLDSTKIGLLAAGYAPDLVDGGSNLKFYFKGNTSSLSAVPPTSTGTADGTTSVTGVGNGPSIIYG